MKKAFIILASCFRMWAVAQTGDPIIDSWIRNTNGQKGSYWQVNGQPPSVTFTFVNSPDSADVESVCYNADTVWIRSDGITVGMGQYQNPGSCLAQNYVFKIPRKPTVPTTKVGSPYVNAIGVLLNGIPIYGLTNANSWNGSGNSNNGAKVWNVEVYLSEGHVLDTAFGAHPQQQGAYHSHATPWRFYKTFSPNVHSPLVGFAFDGYPVYGPHGYSTPTNSASAVTRMKSGYSLRNITTRTTLPDGSTASQTGPTISSTYPLGFYVEDYEYLATNNGDLDRYNGRYCVTPEYPNGTYAYFVTQDAAGKPQFPYYIGTQYYGKPESGNYTIGVSFKIPATATCVTSKVATGIATGSQEDSFRIYPNPASDKVNIYIGEDQDGMHEVTLYDALGRKVLSQSLFYGNNSIELSSDRLHGFYTVRVTSRSGVLMHTVRLIVE